MASPEGRAAMTTHRCLVIIGTRPEAIKMAPVLLELRKHSGQIKTQLVLTGQHREIVDSVTALFGIQADVDLNLMQTGQTLSDFSGRAVIAIAGVLEAERPHLVLVQGDTTTVFAASLAAFYQNIPVGHVEAGLRTRDRRSPFPEEINRRLTTVLADLHFAPTAAARDNLLREHVDASAIFVTGNPVIDALQMIRKHGEEVALRRFPSLADGMRTVLVTCHRRENHGEPLQRVCRAVDRLVEKQRDLQVMWPVHPNPSVAGTVHDLLGGKERIHLLEPLEYETFVGLIALSDLVLTDSGGLQEEAPAMGKPVLVLRDTTERPEGIQAGAACLVGTREVDIVERTSELLEDHALYLRSSHAVSPYGDGKAAERIVGAVRFHFGLQAMPPEPFAGPGHCLAR